MRRAAIDIGTNSVRLLVGDETGEVLRRTVVTGLGRATQQTGKVSEEGRARTIEVLGSYHRDMEATGVEQVRAVMTAVGRNASDVDPFREEARGVLGVAPEVISGEEEARLSYRGAVAHLEGQGWTVVDIGGGSTEIVTVDSAVSYEIGSVGLTDRHLGERPVADADLAAARRHAEAVLAPCGPAPGGLVGVAGTWTSLAAMNLRLRPYRPELVHHSRLAAPTVEQWVERLRRLPVEETARLPGLDPARAPVILGGAIVAASVMAALEAEACLVSEHDLLDGMLAGLAPGNDP